MADSVRITHESSSQSVILRFLNLRTTTEVLVVISLEPEWCVLILLMKNIQLFLSLYSRERKEERWVTWYCKVKARSYKFRATQPETGMSRLSPMVRNAGELGNCLPVDFCGGSFCVCVFCFIGGAFFFLRQGHPETCFVEPGWP